MPVTARLSQKFYERLGEDIAQELVDWFNAVDATYRADLRELNELNFQRFDAKVEQRFAQFEIKVESRLSGVERQLAELRSDLRTEFHTALANRHTSLLRWMFTFWIATVLAVLGLYMR